jgi:hypothetical protein
MFEGWRDDQGHAERTGEMGNCIQILIGKLERITPFGKSTSRQGIILEWVSKRCDGMDWIYLAQDRDQWWVSMNSLTNLRVL